jgi:hypothetical protein
MKTKSKRHAPTNTAPSVSVISQTVRPKRLSKTTAIPAGVKQPGKCRYAIYLHCSPSQGGDDAYTRFLVRRQIKDSFALARQRFPGHSEHVATLMENGALGFSEEEKRPAWTQVISLAKAQRIDAVVISEDARLDMFGGLMQHMINQMADLSVQVVTQDNLPPTARSSEDVRILAGQYNGQR